jgi:transposase
MNSGTVTLTQAEHEALLTELVSIKDDNDRLRYERDQLRKLIFGRSSERHVADDDRPFQASLFDNADLTEDYAREEEKAEEKDKRRGKNRKPRFPKNAKRRVEDLELSEGERACTSCGKERESIGVETSEKLNVIPATFEVIETRRHKYACKNCKNAGVESAPLPPTLFERSRITEETRAHLIVGKYLDHLPLYRQSKILARAEFHYSDSSMSRQVIETADALAMLLIAMREELMGLDYLQADETTLPVLKTERSKPGAHRGYLWAYADPTGTIVYDYARGRSGRHPELFLDGFQGVLQTDRYSGYDAIRHRDGVTDVACWAHARRRFKDAETVAKRRTEPILDLVQKLYAVERKAKERSSEERRAMREHESKPILIELKTLLRKLETQRLAAPLADAVSYTLKHWVPLVRYVEHGEVQIDNNLIENSMRPVALGRKNFLFAGSESGAEAAAVLYSITETCRRLEIDAREYLVDVMKRLAELDRSKIETWQALTPARWKAERLATM